MIKLHQGDVIGMSLPSLPQGAKKIEHKPIALGEHSGHQHVITGDVELFEIEGRVVAVVGSDGAFLQHIHESNFTRWDTKELLPKADHAPIVLKEGVYGLYIQNEYNPYSKIMEKVLD